MGMTGPGKGDDFLRCNGAGEMLVFSAADFEDFLEPRPDLGDSLEAELTGVVSILAANRWPFRLHATYDESISRFLNVFEAVNRETPLAGLNWFFDHCETISDRNIERVKALGGGIAVQHRMAFHGEYFLARYGQKAAERTPPVRKMLEMGIPVGAGTDATRVASYNPWVSLYWLVTGNTVGGVSLYPAANCLSREEALRLYTEGGSWFSGESGLKGTLAPGQYADCIVLSDDYFSVPETAIKSLQSVLTIVDGKIVHATDEFRPFAPPPLPVLPQWAPPKYYGGYGAPLDQKSAARLGLLPPVHEHSVACHSHGCSTVLHQLFKAADAARSSHAGFWGLGCDCFAF
jgi:predicted amidohydrolase YtcJ